MTVGQLLDQHVPDKDSLAVCHDLRLLGVSPDEGVASALMTSPLHTHESTSRQHFFPLEELPSSRQSKLG